MELVWVFGFVGMMCLGVIVGICLDSYYAYRIKMKELEEKEK